MVMPNISQAIGYMSVNKTDGPGQKGKQTTGGFELMLANLKAPTVAFGDGMKFKFADNVRKADKSPQPQNDVTAQANKKTATELKSEPTAGSVRSEQTAKASDDSVGTIDTGRKDSINITDDELSDKELSERISSLLSLVSQLIMDKLELNADEFNKLIEELNMTAVDLLQPDKLQMLVLAGNNEDNVLALLTNEKLASIMKELNMQISDLMDEAGIPQDINTDELKMLLAAAELNESRNTTAKDTASDTNDYHNTDNNDITNENTVESRFATDKKSLATENKISDIDGEATGETETVQNSKGTENTGADKQKQGSDSADQNHFQAFVDRLVNSAGNAGLATDDNVAIVSNLRDIAYQIIEKIRVSVTADQTSLQINLNPEHLGRVNLTIQAREGGMTARFVVENQISKEAIESQLNLLKETLNEQGVKVDAIEVSVAAYAFDQNSGNSQQNRSETGRQNSGRHISIDETIAMSEEESFDDRLAANNLKSDSQINYVA